ncbi:inorganic pyrophosphatase [Parvularcula bermudensis HTCC2503]|uniref:Inorganic pyrophosphatase n=1 Tax=Parvularcula bermudensis (strain ATCC BAA-594 / HTCC2503 / KCTC 12087) TaxID=314260 RepID=E0TD35_PARBH|nr:inorganic diphosphatase [Parvularcula bermudensis]ADM08694.1 inorganic pyrophosphatase [Parvularcula bermudensis HTCC2503]
MDITKIAAGKDVPKDINVIIEVPLGGEPIKYEIDKDSGAMMVDRFLYTSMRYPCNYGFVPHTLSGDGDPVDVMCLGQRPLVPGAVLRARPIGVLLMEDEAGVDEKILAAPHQKLTRFYDNIETYEDVQPILLERIWHFFEHYKDLEPNKFVKVREWQSKEMAEQLISQGLENAKKG